MREAMAIDFKEGELFWVNGGDGSILKAIKNREDFLLPKGQTYPKKIPAENIKTGETQWVKSTAKAFPAA